MATEIVKYIHRQCTVYPHGEKDFVVIKGRKIPLRQVIKEPFDDQGSSFPRYSYHNIIVHCETISNEIEERRAHFYTSDLRWNDSKNKVYISVKEYERLMCNVHMWEQKYFEFSATENATEWTFVVKSDSREMSRVCVAKGNGHIHVKCKDGYKKWNNRHYFLKENGDLGEMYRHIAMACRQELRDNTMLFKGNVTVASVINDILSLYLPPYYKCKDVEQSIVSIAMHCNNVKVPNLWSEMAAQIARIDDFSLKELQDKFKGKILDYYLFKNGIEKNYLAKVINSNNLVNIDGIRWYYMFLGHDMFSEIKNKNFFNAFTMTGMIMCANNIAGAPFRDFDSPFIRPVEKKYMMKLFNEAHNITEVIEIRDYYRMVESLRRNHFDIEFRVRSVADLNVQIAALSALEGRIKSGKNVRYIFHEDMAKELEEELKAGKIVWTPKILRNGDEYIEEGHFQHHCVGGYSNTIQSSFIVSLRSTRESIKKKRREKVVEKENRITLQINYKGDILQAKGYCNEEMMYSETVSAFKGRLSRISKNFRGNLPSPSFQQEAIPPELLAQPMAEIEEEVEAWGPGEEAEIF